MNLADLSVFVYQFSVGIAEGGLRMQGLKRALFTVCYQIGGIPIFLLMFILYFFATGQL